ncbi:MAG: DUF4136 domain-containing protein [Nannocystaceae bacterium]
MPRRSASASASVLVCAAALVVGAHDLACARAIDHHTEYAQGTDFAAIRTYAWVADADVIAASRDAEALRDPAAIERMIRAAVDREMATKGLTVATQESADVLLMFTVGLREDNVAFGINASFGLTYHSGEHASHQHGELSIDVFERASREHIWHGSAAKRIDEDDRAAALIDEAVALILSEFPPR